MPVLKVKLNGTWAEIDGVSGHTHDINDITNLPTSLPANGGNADTLDGKHASDFAIASDVEELKTLVGDIAVSEQITSFVVDHNIATDTHADIREALNNKLNSSELSSSIGTALAQAKESGEFDGEDGISVTHSWSGTTLTITSVSGTSSADLKGDKGDSPVRGTDYWTDTDKAEIKSYVDEAILGGAW